MKKKNDFDSIDEQIIKLQEKKKSLQVKRENEIGKYLLKSWNVSSFYKEDILKLIDSKKPNIKIGDTKNKPSNPNSQV